MPPPVALRFPLDVALYGAAVALVLVSVGFVTLVWTADGLHGPFSLWDAGCYGSEYAPAVTVTRYRMGYSLVAFAVIIDVAAVVAIARRREGLGVLALLLTLLVALVGWWAISGAILKSVPLNYLAQEVMGNYACCSTLVGGCRD